MNEKYDKKTQKRIRALVSFYYIASFLFFFISISLIIYGAISESWIRLVAGFILFVLSNVMYATIKQSIEYIERENART